MQIETMNEVEHRAMVYRDNDTSNPLYSKGWVDENVFTQGANSTPDEKEKVKRQNRQEEKRIATLMLLGLRREDIEARIRAEKEGGRLNSGEEGRRKAEKKARRQGKEAQLEPQAITGQKAEDNRIKEEAWRIIAEKWQKDDGALNFEKITQLRAFDEAKQKAEEEATRKQKDEAECAANEVAKQFLQDRIQRTAKELVRLKAVQESRLRALHEARLEVLREKKKHSTNDEKLENVEETKLKAINEARSRAVEETKSRETEDEDRKSGENEEWKAEEEEAWEVQGEDGIWVEKIVQKGEELEQIIEEAEEEKFEYVGEGEQEMYLEETFHDDENGVFYEQEEEEVEIEEPLGQELRTIQNGVVLKKKSVEESKAETKEQLKPEPNQKSRAQTQADRAFDNKDKPRHKVMSTENGEMQMADEEETKSRSCLDSLRQRVRTRRKNRKSGLKSGEEPLKQEEAGIVRSIDEEDRRKSENRLRDDEEAKLKADEDSRLSALMQLAGIVAEKDARMRAEEEARLQSELEPKNVEEAGHILEGKLKFRESLPPPPPPPPPEEKVNFQIGVVPPSLAAMIAHAQLELRPVPKEHKKSYKPVASDAASIGRVMRLREHVVEGMGKGNTDDDEATNVAHSLLLEKPRKGVKRVPQSAPKQSKSSTIVSEAAAIGKVKMLPPKITDNYERNGSFNYDRDDEIDDMQDSHGARVVRTEFLLERHVKTRDEIKALDALEELNDPLYESVNDVILPSEKVPGFKPTKKLKPRHQISEELSQGVAEGYWERYYRLERPGRDLQVTPRCKCKYCKNPNVFQTYAYQKKWVEERKDYNKEGWIRSMYLPPDKIEEPEPINIEQQIPEHEEPPAEELEHITSELQLSEQEELPGPVEMVENTISDDSPGEQIRERSESKKGDSTTLILKAVDDKAVTKNESVEPIPDVSLTTTPATGEGNTVDDESRKGCWDSFRRQKKNDEEPSTVYRADQQTPTQQRQLNSEQANSIDTDKNRKPRKWAWINPWRPRKKEHKKEMNKKKSQNARLKEKEDAVVKAGVTETDRQKPRAKMKRRLTEIPPLPVVYDDDEAPSSLTRGDSKQKEHPNEETPETMENVISRQSFTKAKLSEATKGTSVAAKSKAENKSLLGVKPVGEDGEKVKKLKAEKESGLKVEEARNTEEKTRHKWGPVVSVDENVTTRIWGRRRKEKGEEKNRKHFFEENTKSRSTGNEDFAVKAEVGKAKMATENIGRPQSDREKPRAVLRRRLTDVPPPLGLCNDEEVPSASPKDLTKTSDEKQQQLHTKEESVVSPTTFKYTMISKAAKGNRVGAQSKKEDGELLDAGPTKGRGGREVELGKVAAAKAKLAKQQENASPKPSGLPNGNRTMTLSTEAAKGNHVGAQSKIEGGDLLNTGPKKRRGEGEVKLGYVEAAKAKLAKQQENASSKAKEYRELRLKAEKARQMADKESRRKDEEYRRKAEEANTVVRLRVEPGAKREEKDGSVPGSEESGWGPVVSVDKTVTRRDVKSSKPTYHEPQATKKGWQHPANKDKLVDSDKKGGSGGRSWIKSWGRRRKEQGRETNRKKDINAAKSTRKEDYAVKAETVDIADKVPSLPVVTDEKAPSQLPKPMHKSPTDTTESSSGSQIEDKDRLHLPETRLGKSQTTVPTTFNEDVSSSIPQDRGSASTKNLRTLSEKSEEETNAKDLVKPDEKKKKKKNRKKGKRSSSISDLLSPPKVSFFEEKTKE